MVLFLLTFAAGLFILIPRTDLHGAMATGDHGRDFYAFERTLHGDVPYQDYWWVYGPIMPYYYAIFDQLLGVNISSVLIGHAALTLLSGMLLFLTVATVGGSLAGATAGLWFFVFGRDFFYTHNHAGGLAAAMLLLLCIVRYICTRNRDWLWTGTVAVFLLAMVKLNFGVVAIPLLMITAWLTDKAWGIPPDKQRTFFHGFLLFVLPALIALVYWSLLYGLTPGEIFQCLPYAGADHPYHMSPPQALMLHLRNVFTLMISGKAAFLFGALVLAATLRFLFMLGDKNIPLVRRKTGLLVLILSGMAWVLFMHEYLASGVPYRAFWAQPAGLVWMFTVMAMAMVTLPRTVRVLAFSLLIATALVQQHHNAAALETYRSWDRYLAQSRAGVFTTNTPDWVRTVTATTEWLERMVPSDETFLALPYDPIYYYLTGRKSPTRQLIFFDHINIAPEQEQSIIRELNRARINFVVLSSRMQAVLEPGLGVFGTTYCPLLAAYIRENFSEVAQFGDWQHEPGWAGPHGTLILQRKGLRQ